ncbi:uncharacterized protein METZ01_LOCUS510422, partial [marine metagenome]
MKSYYVTKVAAFIFIAVSVVHLTNFFIGGVISIWDFSIPPSISLVTSFILVFLAIKLIT